MAEIEDSSSPELDLEIIAQKALTKSIQEKAARLMDQKTSRVETTVIEEDAQPIAASKELPQPRPQMKKKRSAKKSNPEKAGAKHHQSNDPHSRALARKYEQERKAMQKNMNELAKKRERDIRELMDVAIENSYSQIDKERQEFMAILAELRDTIHAQSKEAMDGFQQLSVSSTEAEVERMVAWFHDEFMKELTKKSQEYEELKTLSDMKVNGLFEENQAKSHEITSLDAKIKKIVSALPEDVRAEVFEELGLQRELGLKPKQPVDKKPRKGLLSKLKAIFGNGQKKKKSKASRSSKPTKGKKGSEIKVHPVAK